MSSITKTMAVALLIAGVSAGHSFETSDTSGVLLGRGSYLVQDETDDRAEICHSQSKIVADISALDPDVKIVQHDYPSGNSYLVVYLSNTGGIIMPIDPAKFICKAVPLSPRQAFAIREQADNPDSKITVTPVWPQQEE